MGILRPTSLLVLLPSCVCILSSSVVSMSLHYIGRADLSLSLSLSLLQVEDLGIEIQSLQQQLKDCLRERTQVAI